MSEDKVVSEEQIVSLVDVLQEDEELEEEASAVLAGSDSDHCSYPQGYVKRQALYACNTCTPKGGEAAGVCLACSYKCHEGHDLFELYTKRNFRCDCGNGKFTDQQCKLFPDKDEVNSLNNYSHNFFGMYCTCERPYPDPDDQEEDVMIQCVVCEDWLHGRHLGCLVPDCVELQEMICESCMNKSPLLWTYAAHLAVPRTAGEVVVKEEPEDEREVNPALNGPEETDDVTEPSCKRSRRETEPSCHLKELQALNLKREESGAVFWPSGWRRKLCSCSSCECSLTSAGLSFLLDESDTVLAYENKGKSNEQSQQGHDPLMSALDNLNRVQQLEIIHGYNDMKTELKDFLQGFAAEGKVEDYITKLQNFSKLDSQSKQKVITDGRPMPELKGLLQTTRQKITRSFQTEWYTRKDWLCGCPARNRLYCFPCLLFSNCDLVWTKTGYCDMKNLTRSLVKHERSTAHIQSQIALKTFETPRIDFALNEQRRLNVSIHNAEVKENREVLRDLINAICFLAKQEVASRGDVARACYSDRGDYAELLHAFAEKDERLARHLKASSVFSGPLNGIQYNLIEAVSDVIRNDIKKEINAASFVAVEVDETTDVANESWISVILRYVVLKSDAWEAKETFLGLGEVGDDGGAPTVAAFILGMLEEYKCVQKLVAQTYDGAAVTAAELDAVQAKVKEAAPEAILCHCYAHNLSLVLRQSANRVPECLTFFKTLEGLGTFFSKSTKRTHALDDVAMRRLPAGWSSNSRLLQTASAYWSDLRAVFRRISQNPGSWDNDTLMMAEGYNRWLSKTSTWFLIMAYEGIFAETDALSNVLWSKAMDAGSCRSRIQDAAAAIGHMRQEFDAFYVRYEQKCAALGLTDSGSGQSVRDERKRVFFDILDDVGAQMRARFDHFSELAFLGLVDCGKFREMSQRFDDAKLQSLSKYERFFDLARLKADLVGLYSSQTVRDACKSPGQLLSFLAQKDLIQTVPEATKLLQLALTMPATAASPERSFSALKRLKSYSRNRTQDGRPSSLAIIAVEAERLLKLKENKEDFYKKVTELFVEKDRRPDFIYQ